MRFPTAGRRSGRPTPVTLEESTAERPRRSGMARPSSAGGALSLGARAPAGRAASPASAAPVCAGDLDNYANRITLESIVYEGRLVELRYALPPQGDRCAG